MEAPEESHAYAYVQGRAGQGRAGQRKRKRNGGTTRTTARAYTTTDLRTPFVALQRSKRRYRMTLQLPLTCTIRPTRISPWTTLVASTVRYIHVRISYKYCSNYACRRLDGDDGVARLFGVHKNVVTGLNNMETMRRRGLATKAEVYAANANQKPHMIDTHDVWCTAHVKSVVA